MRAVKLRSAFKVLATAVFVAAATLGLLWAVSSVVQPKNNQKEFGQVSEAANGDLRRAGPLPRCDIHRRQRGVQLVLPVADVGRAWLHLVRKRYVGSAIDVRVPIAGKSASFPKAQGRRIRNELHLLADQAG